MGVGVSLRRCNVPLLSLVLLAVTVPAAPARLAGQLPSQNLTAPGTAAWVGPAAASALLPGAGQLLRGQNRGYAYLAAEAAVWAVWLDSRGDGGELRSRYRDLAWEVARGYPTPRMDGDFEYFERMIRWDRSGAFDADPVTAGIQPESDPTTFNGDAWRLARGLFWNGAETPPSPEAEAAALEYYRERAYGEAFEWDWSQAPEQKARFVQLISDSDAAFRRARIAVGGLLLNRLLSATDAFLSNRVPGDARLRMRPGPATGAFTSSADPYLVLSWTLPSGAPPAELP